MKLSQQGGKEVPEYKWKCNLFGGNDNDIIWQVEKAPNIFWRVMQYLILGNKWTKIASPKTGL